MAINVLQPDIKEKAQRSLTSLQEVAETVKIDALQQARAKSSQPMHGEDISDLLQRRDFFTQFKLGLAERVANTLAAHDEQVQEIYYFDPYLNPDAETETYTPLDSSVDLLVLVKSKSAALESFIVALDRALTEEIRKLPSAQFASLVSVLNAILITAEDVEQRRGYAVLLSSMYMRPLQVW